ncbi:hypothetical protein [Chachezhania sediminis]|uniref:hypothetical protein n=1 Tax=Chachezhania sediminis TaxID=2599291 RepID=UPI00131E9E5F|nr:hypothetical protein [Chachezhania sediminis]
MSWTLSEAARETGLSKSTISRAIKSGKVSAQRQEDGSYRIEPAEVFRVYPRVAQPGEPAPKPLHDAMRNPHEEPAATPSVDEEKLRVENAMLREMLERERDDREKERADREEERRTHAETVADLRKRLDTSSAQVLALAKPEQPIAGNPQEPPVKRGLLGWFRR